MPGAGLGFAAFRDPGEEAPHARALAPHEREEFARVQIGGFLAEKSFEPPLDVGRCPGTQPVALCCDPVVVQRVEHESRQGNMTREFQENRTVRSDCAAQKERAEPLGSALFL